MGNVVNIGCITSLDLAPERILQAAIDKGLTGVVVIGYAEDGNEYFASSIADGGTVNWLLDRSKMKLLSIPETHADLLTRVTDGLEGEVLPFPKEPA